jgi:hypothetical protein
LGEVVAYLKERDPRHVGFINLLPNWAAQLNVLGTKTYDEYVRTFVEKVKPAMISYDNYAMTTHGDRPEFFTNLQTVGKISSQTNTPFWNIVLAVQHGDYRNLNEPEMRLEAMQTLAYGGKGLMWFTYFSPKETDSSTTWDHAIINPDGSRDPHYEMVKQVNGDVLAIAHELRGAKSIAVYEPPTKATHDAVLPADALLRVTSDQLTVGVFQRGDSHLALLASRDYKLPINTRVGLAHGGDYERFDSSNRSWTKGGNAETIPAGAALLIRW